MADVGYVKPTYLLNVLGLDVNAELAEGLNNALSSRQHEPPSFVLIGQYRMTTSKLGTSCWATHSC